MREEKSCGAVVFNGERFLLLLYPAGHWGAPKGHVEEGEDERETVRREVREETGIDDLEFVPGFRERIRYTYKAGGVIRDKSVFFFLASTGQEEVELSHEHEDYAWLDYEAALERITYEEEKDILKKARAHLREHDSSLDKFF